MKNIRKILPALLLLVTLTPSAVAANSSNGCVVDNFTRIEQQFVLSTFGQSAAQYFTSNDEMKSSVLNLNAEEVKGCTGDIPSISAGVLNILIGVVVSISVAISVIILYSALSNAGLGFFLSQSSGKSKLAQHSLVFLAVVAAMPLGFLITKNEDDKMAKYYSPLNHLAFYATGLASEVAANIDSLFTSPSAPSMPTYITPDPAFLAIRNSEINEMGYEQNAMSHVLSYAACVISETDPNQLQNLIDTGILSETDSALTLELGNKDNGCYLSSSMHKNTYTVDQLISAEEDSVALRYSSAEREVFRSAVLNAVQQSIDYKLAQYKAVGRAYSIKDRDLKIKVGDDWWETCSSDLSEIVSIETSSVNISELIEQDRKAELCLSKNIVSKFYPNGFEYKGKRAPHRPEFESEFFNEVVFQACDIKPEEAQAGMFDCAVATEMLTHDKHQQHINNLGWAVKPINAMTLLKQVAPPIEPQQSLATWQFDFSEYQSDSSESDSELSAIRKRFIEATNNTSAGRVELIDLLAEGRPASSVVTDLLGIADVRTCLNSPNQLIYNEAGEVIHSCGSPLSTLNDLGGTMIKTYALLQAGHYAKGVMSKMIGKNKREKNEVDGKLSSKKEGSTGLGAIAAIAGAGVVALLGAGLFSTEVLEPFMYTSSDAMSVLGGASAFVIGAALTDGLLSFSNLILMGGLVLKFGLPLMLVLPFCIALIRVLLILMQLTMQLVVVIMQPLIEAKDVRASYLSLLSRFSLSVLTLASLPLFFYLSVITSELVLPLVLSVVDELASNATSGTGSVSAIVFSVVIYTLLYIAFAVLMFYKTTDIYKNGWEVSKLIFSDSGASQLNQDAAQGSAREVKSTVTGMFKK